MYKLKMAETTGPERQQSFDHLVIPSKTKRLLQALVKNHGITTESPGGNEDDFKNEIDIVKGKGNGVVIFLYGPPGVGKVRVIFGQSAMAIDMRWIHRQAQRKRLQHTATQLDHYTPL